MKILIDLTDPRNVRHQCCAALLLAGRREDAELLWEATETSRDDREVLMHLPADVRPEIKWGPAR